MVGYRSGVDARHVDAAGVAKLLDAVRAHGVVVLEGQNLSRAEQVAFTEAPGRAGTKHRLASPWSACAPEVEIPATFEVPAQQALGDVVVLPPSFEGKDPEPCKAARDDGSRRRRGARDVLVGALAMSPQSQAPSRDPARHELLRQRDLEGARDQVWRVLARGPRVDVASRDRRRGGEAYRTRTGRSDAAATTQIVRGRVAKREQLGIRTDNSGCRPATTS